MKSKMNINKHYTHILSIILFILSCAFMYNFYKALSGFIANGFREPFVMLPIILSYLLPVLCNLFYFYDVYIENVNKLFKYIYCSITFTLGVGITLFLFLNLDVYMSNLKLGGYDTLLKAFGFPIDSLIVCISLIVIQMLNITYLIFPLLKINTFKFNMKHHGLFKIKLIEYLAICVLAILVFVFVGAFINGFKAIDNTLYDPKYIFLMLWVLIVPLISLIYLIFKFELLNISKTKKIIILSSNILVNIIFGILLLIFELNYPSFIAQIGKPLFAIAFSISLPIEMGILLGIMLLSIVINSTKIIKICVSKK